MAFLLPVLVQRFSILLFSRLLEILTQQTKYKQIIETSQIMELLSEPPLLSEKPNTFNEDSDQRKDSACKPQPTKKKIIRKKNNTKTKKESFHENLQSNDTKNSNNMAPFGIFQSETQKCQRLQHYLKKDIENFYKTQVSASDYQMLDSFLNNNLIQLSDVYHKDLSEVWKEKICSLSEIRSYLELVNKVSKHSEEYKIFQDEKTKKKFALFQEEEGMYEMYQINQFEAHLLEKRQSFLNIIKQSQQKLRNSGKQLPINMSQISLQIAFIFKSLYDSTKTLNNRITNLKKSIEQIVSSQTQVEPYYEIQRRYTFYLVKKLISGSLCDNQIDYLNFFKNQEFIEHSYSNTQSVLSQQKEFEEFMKKKKNKKGRKGKYVLHTACLGCCSPYFQQYNPFSFCQQCYIRFHRSCYTGYAVNDEYAYFNGKQEKGVLCEVCYHKKSNSNYKIRGSQCDYCGLKGILNTQAGPGRRIHILCMLLNGLWTVNNGRIQFKSKTENKVPISDSLKCGCCGSSSGYLHFCCKCERYAHASCAYFNGWRIDAQFSKSNEYIEIELRLQCCQDVPTGENEKRRKFITNYKKYAYSF